MAELRWNAMLKDWVMVASHRQQRPQMPKNWCPFCPGSGKVPEQFAVYRYPNDFPALSINPPEPDAVDTDALFGVMPAYGVCEVLLYSSDHNATMSSLDDAHVHQLARMWREVYQDIGADPQIEYVFIFENRGAPVGVTMPHPHGQVYGYPFIPKRVEQKLTAMSEHMDLNGTCLICDLLEAEQADGRRIIFENDYFAVYVPFASQMVYSTHVVAKRHLSDIAKMDEKMLCALGETVRDAAGMYDCLFDVELPYMMCMYNAPMGAQPDRSFHFHIEFLPPMRNGSVQQFFASSETGAGAWCNPACPEEKAEELRRAYHQYKAR